MSTHANIRIKRTDGTTAGIYLHFDDYIEGAGVLLQLAYNTPEKVEELISLGDISSLRCYTVPNDILEAKGEVTIAYHRDRGEPFRQTMQNDEFIYTYDASLCCWFVTEYEHAETPATSEMVLGGIWLQKEHLLLDELIMREEVLNAQDYWETDEFAEKGKVLEACKQKAVEARQPLINAYEEWQEIYTR